MLLDNIALFLTIVEKGSLTAAGREVGLSPTTVSERLAALETHYGVVLLNRTTRAISLTEEGRTLVEGARELLNGVGDLDTRIRHGAETLTGTIRLSAPSDRGRHLISHALTEFQATHPGIRVELLLSDGYVDIVGEGIDLALRFGAIMDSTLRVRSLGDARRLVCASPAYLEAHGVPHEPADLRSHNCLMMRFGQNLDNEWRFETPAGPQIVTVSGNRVANDGAMVRQWGLEGLGVVLKSELDVAEDIRRGRLIELLQGHAAQPAPVQLLFPPARTQPRRVKALADHLVETFATLEPLPWPR
ncbi:LysR family transcriptional regulator [Halomonas getboli]|uniref:LysR family transcriptional regulator n=1 Tax=Halomonas getboli TaxID=2935862 RepID=UPI001FFF6A29|nr:LysR family transcriptional regulator [Halomonas getboli]MCK2183630.1 LysR family transcriptional regulator [Halomonas getboli]